MGSFTFSSRSACSWIGVGDEGTLNPGFPGPDGLMRFHRQSSELPERSPEVAEGLDGSRAPSLRSGRLSIRTARTIPNASRRPSPGASAREAPRGIPRIFSIISRGGLVILAKVRFFDLAALAVRKADQDLGWRFAIRDDIKEHGQILRAKMQPESVTTFCFVRIKFTTQFQNRTELPSSSGSGQRPASKCTWK